MTTTEDRITEAVADIAGGLDPERVLRELLSDELQSVADAEAELGHLGIPRRLRNHADRIRAPR